MNSSKRVLNISEALSLAFHALDILTVSKALMSARSLASLTGFSSHHISKVMRKLVENGIVSVSHGAHGGFYLTAAQRRKRLAEVYKAIEGRLDFGTCLYQTPLCDCSKCIFGDLLRSVAKEFESFLKNTKIGSLSGALKARVDKMQKFL